MGGNAIKNSVRMSTEQYKTICKIVHCKLLDIVTDAAIIPSYETKESHGDIDILINRKLSANEIKNNFDVDGIHVNSDVTSFGFKYEGDTFQIDLIYQSDDTFNFALNYFAYNDLSNLVGRIAHKMGLRFGHDGLWMPLRNGTNLYHTILITRNFRQAIKFLGLDDELWSHGFSTLTNIFEFVRSSKYFDSDIYLLDNRNAIARSRDSKRKTYNEFLKYNQKFPKSNFKFDKDKSKYLQLIFSEWPFVEYEMNGKQIGQRILQR